MITIESMFQLEEQALDLRELDVTLIDPYPNQPFKLYKENKLKELAEDINRNGLINPVIVRPVDNRRYQMLAGHNRLNAFKYLEKSKIPALIKPCSDEEAMIIVTQSNLLQRQKLSNKEKAFAYKMRQDAMKKQGERSGNSNEPYSSLDELSKTEKESSRTIARYIRATKLIPELLDLFDDNKISLPTADQLARLSDDQQKSVFNYSQRKDIKIKTADIKKIAKNFSHGTQLTEYDIEDVVNSPEKNTSSPKPSISVIVKAVEEANDRSLSSQDIVLIKDVIKVLDELDGLKYKIKLS
ncbi:ParB/RepB/Spo0J family partition protein [Hutsoniella sourekii]|uniref:ParB/RepB/Spo0J family partition protein n=1 Tax=Hutsoniella sourekii TaxID=87650 RepID=UPI0004858C86|nr:ParB/RepB/Spo0J family partition protein [Hutsoniella sourekii]